MSLTNLAYCLCLVSTLPSLSENKSWASSGTLMTCTQWAPQVVWWDRVCALKAPLGKARESKAVSSTWLCWGHKWAVESG